MEVSSGAVERPLPPRAPGFPLVGHLLAYGRDPIAFFERCARDHGDLVELKFPGFPRTFLVNHPDVIEDILVTRQRLFHKDVFTRELRRLLGNGLLTSEGDFWRRQRRLAQPAFHRDRIRGFAAAMVELTLRMLATWRPDTEIDLHARMMQLTLQIVAKTLFGKDVDEEARVVGQAIELWMRRYASMLVVTFPWLMKLPTPQNRRTARATRRLNEIIYGLIERARRGPEGSGDLLPMLLSARDEDGACMSDEQLRDEVMTIFLAGHETTAIALSWTFMLLARHPAVRAALHGELSQELGGRAPTLEDLSRLRYTDAVVREAMRLYPPAWSIGREAQEECELGGYRIPRGSQLVICQILTQRDARWFPEPERFRPERWLDGSTASLPRFAYFPFGGGPRVCIGNTFALMEAALIVATVAQRYELALRPGFEPQMLASVTLRPRLGMPMRLTAR
jgi:cytochrome P450